MTAVPLVGGLLAAAGVLLLTCHRSPRTAAVGLGGVGLLGLGAADLWTGFGGLWLVGLVVPDLAAFVTAARWLVPAEFAAGFGLLISAVVRDRPPAESGGEPVCP